MFGSPYSHHVGGEKDYVHLRGHRTANHLDVQLPGPLTRSGDPSALSDTAVGFMRPASWIFACRLNIGSLTYSRDATCTRTQQSVAHEDCCAVLRDQATDARHA